MTNRDKVIELIKKTLDAEVVKSHVGLGIGIHMIRRNGRDFHLLFPDGNDVVIVVEASP